MIKLASSALLGAAFGIAIGAYVMSGPALTAGYRHAAVKPVTIDPSDLTKQARDLPVLVIENPI